MGVGHFNLIINCFGNLNILIKQGSLYPESVINVNPLYTTNSPPKALSLMFLCIFILVASIVKGFEACRVPGLLLKWQ